MEMASLKLMVPLFALTRLLEVAWCLPLVVFHSKKKEQGKRMLAMASAIYNSKVHSLTSLNFVMGSIFKVISM